MGSRRVLLITMLLALAALACSAGLPTDNNETTAADLQTAPLVLVLAPVNGSIYAEGTRVELSAIAQDSADRESAGWNFG